MEVVDRGAGAAEHQRVTGGRSVIADVGLDRQGARTVGGDDRIGVIEQQRSLGERLRRTDVIESTAAHDDTSGRRAIVQGTYIRDTDRTIGQRSGTGKRGCVTLNGERSGAVKVGPVCLVLVEGVIPARGGAEDAASHEHITLIADGETYVS